MKRLVFFMVWPLLLMACQQKDNAAKETETEEAKGPVALIEFPEGTDFDFGSYTERVEKSHAFAVHNPGDVPLVIDTLITSCYCTKAVGPTKPILKGETDSIVVTYDGDGFSEGVFVKHVYVLSNAAEPSDLIVRGSFFNPLNN
jgi:hypothetical protein